MALNGNIEEGLKMENNELLQQYFDNFHKEIGSDGSIHITSTTKDLALDATASSGTYFMDQDGHYYFQAAPDQPAIETVIEELPENFTITEDIVNDNSIPLEQQEQEITISEDSNNMIIPPNQVFQTVTILPSESVNGEVSYVLIVQQNDDKSQTEETTLEHRQENVLTVYDFDENEEMEGQEVDSDEVEDDKSKIVKLPMMKKSQTVTQAYMCSYCNYTSPKRYLLSRHLKSHSEERPHKCSVCERGFKTIASLQNHVNTHTGTKPHRCRFCESAFTTSGELSRHKRYKHSMEKPYKCSICTYACVESSKLQQHMRTHTGERPYQCEHCTYASPDTFKLKRHLRTHTHERPYECDSCDMRFTQSNSLKAHKLIHNIGEKPIFPCTLCPTTCGRKTDLRIHIQKLHTSDKPLKCKRCGKSFPDRYSYKVHNKTHEGEKCFKCEMCPYASISQRHLISHMLIHTDEKPFSCELCDQTFRQKQLLKRHQNLYHNPIYVPPSPREKSHECRECGRQFRHKGNLIRHMALHDPDSTVHETSLALKLGRQMKIHVINNGQTTSGSVDESEEEEEEQDMVELVENLDRVNNDEMDQFVVLEVIQLKAGTNEEQQVAVIANNNYDEKMNTQETIEVIEEVVVTKREEDSDSKTSDTNQDMKNCFGFDEDLEEEDDPKNEESQGDVNQDESVKHQ